MKLLWILFYRSPAMHVKKRAEADIIKTIKEKVSAEAKVYGKY